MSNYEMSKRKSDCGKALRHIVLIIWCMTTVFPLLWVFLIAFKGNNQIFTDPFGIPDPWITTNFPTVFQKLDILTGLKNSLIYSFATVFLVCLLSSMTGFYLAKYARGKLLYMYFILGMMIPVQAIAIPMFVKLRDAGLNNTRPGIILVYTVIELGFAVFVMTGFIKRSVPDELLEAAAIDGCSMVGAFFRVALPLMKTGIATVGTFVFLHVWNEFFFGLILLTNSKLTSLNLTTYKLRGQYSSDYGLLAAGIIVLAVPALVIYAIFQEQVVKGLTAGAVKE